MKRETGKDRWRRVPKDYFKKSDAIQRAKLALAAVAGLLAVGWWAIGVGWADGRSNSPDLNSLRANHGELARVHAAWEAKCDACHVPFQPIDGRPLFSSKSLPESRMSDKLCETCHLGPSHHESMKAAEVKGCAECHRDHQGREFSLVRLNDTECTSCHGAISDHVDVSAKPGGARTYADVSRFAEGEKEHPPFRPETAKVGEGGKLVDLGKLKFNHALHMSPGLVGTNQTPYTAERIPIEAERARYQKSGKPGDPIQLDCASCHALDSSEIKSAPNPAIGASPSPARSSGRYYLPVTFENDCRACHTLTFDPLPGLKDLQVPHGVQPDKVLAYLEGVYARTVVANDPSVLNRKVTLAPLAGKRPDDVKAAQLFRQSIETATRTLFENKTSCLECHDVQKDANGMPTKVEPTRVPGIWFTHASFDHSAHRAISCRDCHPASYALEADGKTPSKGASTVATDVLIPGKENCVQCHAPAKSQAGWFSAPSASKSTGGASFDCTECHRYHNGDNVLQGYGAPARDAAREASILDFLAGPRGQSPKPAEKPASK